MKKRNLFVTVILALALSFTALAACGETTDNGGGGTEPTPEPAEPEQPAENAVAEPQTQPEQPAENAEASAAAQNLLCGKLAYTLPEGWYLVNKNTAATLAAQPDAAAVFAAAQGADFFQKCAQMETDEIYNALED